MEGLRDSRGHTGGKELKEAGRLGGDRIGHQVEGSGGLKVEAGIVEEFLSKVQKRLHVTLWVSTSSQESLGWEGQPGERRDGGKARVWTRADSKSQGGADNGSGVHRVSGGLARRTGPEGSWGVGSCMTFLFTRLPAL